MKKGKGKVHCTPNNTSLTLGADGKNLGSVKNTTSVSSISIEKRGAKI